VAAIVRRDGQVRFASDHGPKLWRCLDAPPRYFAALNASRMGSPRRPSGSHNPLARTYLPIACS
jgi:hypothetical protein